MHTDLYLKTITDIANTEYCVTDAAGWIGTPKNIWG